MHNSVSVHSLPVQARKAFHSAEHGVLASAAVRCKDHKLNIIHRIKAGPPPALHGPLRSVGRLTALSAKPGVAGGQGGWRHLCRQHQISACAGEMEGTASGARLPAARHHGRSPNEADGAAHCSEAAPGGTSIEVHARGLPWQCQGSCSSRQAVLGLLCTGWEGNEELESSSNIISDMG